MKSEYCKRKNTKKTEISELDLSDLLQPSWIRCPIPPGNDMDWIVLAYGCNILWRVGITLWCLFFTFQAIT